MHKPSFPAAARAGPQLRRRVSVPVPRELLDYWDRRLLERRNRDWT